MGKSDVAGDRDARVVLADDLHVVETDDSLPDFVRVVRSVIHKD
jgi:hypothetical protein